MPARQRLAAPTADIRPELRRDRVRDDVGQEIYIADGGGEMSAKRNSGCILPRAAGRLAHPSDTYE
jgi:hypothetical protein